MKPGDIDLLAAVLRNAGYAEDAVEQEIGRLTGAGASRLECERCGHHTPLSTEQAIQNMRTGWPLHCGYTMTLVLAVRRSGVTKNAGGSSDPEGGR